MSISLFEHNQKAYDSAVAMLRETGKAAIIHPTGTGKSFIGFKLCEDNPDKTICWLSPSDYIFKTQLESLAAVTGGWTPDNIKFYTYQKLLYMEEADFDDIQANYTIIDEFHRCGSEKFNIGVMKVLSRYPNAPVLGLSATNIRYLDNQRDMADELFDGNIASHLSLGEAVVRNILPSPVYITAMYTYEKDYEKYKKRVMTARSIDVRRKGERYLEALRRAIDKSDGLDEIFHKHIKNKNSKFIFFCAGREHMNEMIEHIPEWFGKIDSEPNVYKAYSGDPETNKAFADFKADKSEHLKLLFCIDMLNEGVHVDDIDGVILFRPTVSPIVFKQQIGRALTAGKGNDPIIFDIVDNMGSLYSISAIQEEMDEAIRNFNYCGESRYIVNEKFRIIDEVRNCREIFDELDRALIPSFEVMFKAAEAYYNEYHNLYASANYRTEDNLSLGSWIVTMRGIYRGRIKGTITDEQTKQLESIGMDWRTLHERQWDDGYARAKAFYDKHQHLSVPVTYEYLSHWIMRQRQKYKANELSDEQFEKLSAIGMIWDLADVWEVGYSAAKKYFEANNSLDIPAEYITEDGYKLGRWYRSVRSAYRKGTLSEDRKRRLEEIGIEWTSVKLRNWMDKYQIAKAYYESNKTLAVNNRFVTEDGVKLGVWISSQRESYFKNRLSSQQIKMLEDIGMSWNRFDTMWQTGYEHAKMLYERQGNLNCPSDHMEDGYNLSAWLNSQKRKYKKGRLLDEHAKMLEDIGIVWNASDDAWERNYADLVKFFEKNGHLNTDRDTIGESGAKIGIFVINQRSRRKQGKLCEDRIKKLDELCMVWELYEDKWASNLHRLEEYKKKFGNANVPQNYITDDGFALGQFVSTCRKRAKSGRLKPERKRELEKLGVEFDTVVKFVETSSTARVNP